MARFLAERPGVVNLHLAVQIEDRARMKMLYRIAQGPVKEANYGITLAKVIEIPPAVIARAEEVSNSIRRNRENRVSNQGSLIQARKRKVLMGLEEHLVQVKEGSLRGGKLRVYLKGLQDKLVRRFSELEGEEIGTHIDTTTTMTTSSTTTDTNISTPIKFSRSTNPITTASMRQSRSNGYGAVATNAITISSAAESDSSMTSSGEYRDGIGHVWSPSPTFERTTRDSRFTMAGAL